MLTRIVHNNAQLCTFIAGLELPVTRPQRQHITNMADALLVTDAPKTLAELQRQFVRTTDASNLADCLRIAPWGASELREQLLRCLITLALERLRAQGLPWRLLLNLDDSLAIKDPDTRHLQGVDWHWDHAAKHRGRQMMQNSWAYLLCQVVAGDWRGTFDIQPYLRAKTVRRLNRQRSPQQRLRYVCNYRLVRGILEALHDLLPQGVQVRVQFDSWYASARLLRYIRRQGWHAVCRVLGNRHLNRQRLDQRFRTQQHRRYSRVTISAADGTTTHYLLRDLVGHLREVPFAVRAWESRRHYRDHRPVYFISTDLTLSPQEAMAGYAQRWGCEVDHWYLKQRLGLGDFRVQSYEAIGKFVMVVRLAWAYVQWRLWLSLQDAQPCTPAEVIRQHRDQHAADWLRSACEQALATGQVQPVLQRFLHQDAAP